MGKNMAIRYNETTGNKNIINNNILIQPIIPNTGPSKNPLKGFYLLSLQSFGLECKELFLVALLG